MSDQINQPGNEQQQPASGQASDNQQPGPVPYERFKEINEQYRTLKAQFEQIQAADKAKREKELTEQQQWQQLAQQHEAELKAERTRNLRMKIALTKGLPADLIDRLQGDTEEALTADADKLLSFIAKPAAPSAPGVPPGGRNAQPARLDIGSMTPAEIRKNRDQLWRQTAG